MLSGRTGLRTVGDPASPPVFAVMPDAQLPPEMTGVEAIADARATQQRHRLAGTQAVGDLNVAAQCQAGCALLRVLNQNHQLVLAGLEVAGRLEGDGRREVGSCRRNRDLVPV